VQSSIQRGTGSKELDPKNDKIGGSAKDISCTYFLQAIIDNCPTVGKKFPIFLMRQKEGTRKREGGG